MEKPKGVTHRQDASSLEMRFYLGKPDTPPIPF